MEPVRVQHTKAALEVLPTHQREHILEQYLVAVALVDLHSGIASGNGTKLVGFVPI